MAGAYVRDFTAFYPAGKGSGMVLNLALLLSSSAVVIEKSRFRDLPL